MQETKESNRKNARVYVYNRWSSAEQSDGDSLRRQNQLADNWCSRRGLQVTKGEIDGGISAWKGKNRSEGSGLSRLLKIVKSGDYLLVEDNDRLSRQDWLTAMNFLSEIVAKGVTVVTLSNGNEIDAVRFRNDPGCFLPAILRAHLGNDENNKKSERIKASWDAKKQALASGKAVNLHLPCWLDWDTEAGKPVLVERNAKVIRKMFEWSLEGLGCQTIARRMHREGCKLIVKGKRRERQLSIGVSYVWRTLRNKLAIGTSIYSNPPQPGLYPAVVDEKTFYSVQAKIDGNKHQCAPRAQSEANLFTGIARCEKCGGALCRFTQCRNGKSYRYLVCSDTLHKHGRCGMSSIRYDYFERSFGDLLTKSGLIAELLTGEKKESKVDELNGRIAVVDREVAKVMKLIDGDDAPPKTLVAKLKDLEVRREKLNGELEQETAAVIAAPAPKRAYEQLKTEFSELDPKRRQEIKTLIPDLIEKIVVRLGEDRYLVHVRGCLIPIDVVLGGKGSGWLFSPSPDWVVENKTMAA